MGRVRVPTLSRHPRYKYWRVQSTVWPSGEKHLAPPDADQKEVEKAYLDAIEEWRRLRAWKKERRAEKARLRGYPKRVNYLIERLAREFLEIKAREGKDGYYRAHLRRFVGPFQNVDIREIRPSDLQLLVEEMQRGGYHPKTIQHDLGCVKTFLRWASLRLDIPMRDFGAVRAPTLPPTLKKALSWPETRAFVLGAPDPVRPWLAVQYLTAARPSEMIRIIQGDGSWEEPWLFVCNSKTTWRTREFRRIVFSEEALEWLKRCEPRWTRRDAYYRAVARKCGPGGPHPLRHSAATHLAQVGVTRSDIDLLLGHLPSRVSLTYVPVFWQHLRQIATHLTLRDACPLSLRPVASFSTNTKELY